MAKEKTSLTISEKIDRARDGRTQSWIIIKMRENGIKITDSQFSRKKKGYEDFSKEELDTLSTILDVKL
jgi:hypothetical protein